MYNGVVVFRFHLIFTVLLVVHKSINFPLSLFGVSSLMLNQGINELNFIHPKYLI